MQLVSDSDWYVVHDCKLSMWGSLRLALITQVSTEEVSQRFCIYRIWLLPVYIMSGV